ncbi:MAG: hypothetical protein AAGC70_12345 [Pseudomonadota bacterium]
MTLIEVVVSIALVSLIALIVHQSVSLARRAHSTQQIRLTQREDERFVDAILIALAHTAWSNVDGRTAQDAPPTLIGTQSSVHFVSSYAPRASYQGLLNYRLGMLPDADGTIALDVTPHRPQLPTRDTSTSNAHRARRSICRFELRYYDRDGQVFSSWNRPGVLPLRIGLTFQSAHGTGVCSQIVINRTARLVYAR